MGRLGGAAVLLAAAVTVIGGPVPAIGATRSAGVSRAAVTGPPVGNTASTVYVDTRGHVNELSYKNGIPWTRADLSALTGAPPASGNPMGYYTTFDGPAARVIYRSNGQVYELWRRPGGAWALGNLTALTGAAANVAGDPAGYTTNFGAVEADVVYRGTDGHIHQLSYRFGTSWSHSDLSVITHAPAAAGDPMGYFTDFDGPAERVVYRGTDWHIHELWTRNGISWSRGDLSALAHAPAAAGDPMGYFTDFDGPAARVVYRGTDWHIHELWYRPGTSWSHGDLTTITGAPATAQSAPYGYSYSL